jgi:hypothetical protein
MKKEEHEKDRGREKGQENDGQGLVGFGRRVENEERSDDDQGKGTQRDEHPPVSARNDYIDRAVSQGCPFGF